MASSSIYNKIFKYDVFLSFCGEDVRKTFVDHLNHALQQKSIHTYKDDEKINQGNWISDELIGAIEDSQLYIIVFSTNYASSSWCLDELVKIMECHKTKKHTAYPVFYDVDPTEVRKQSGAVGKAFSKLENEGAAEKWRKALTEAANLAGFVLNNTADGHENKFIQKVVEQISLELRSINFRSDEKLVGMETRINDVLSSLRTGFDDVHMVGIKGMGGGGKTTLARAIFDQISYQFEGKSFVEKVREVSKVSPSGLNSLQNQILSDIFNDKGMTVSSVHEGIHMMKRRMPGKKVLLVLDDVDHKEQLKALAGETTWFKPGSIVIITTRDRQVLESYEAKSIHDVRLLSHGDAMCLFSRYAFGKVIPNPRFKELSRQVVHYAAGLPLAIEVLGSFLCGKDELEWMDALLRLKTIPSQEILEILEITYRGLENDYKEIFLNVACLLKGWSKADAIKALESCGFHARIGLKVLEQKSLITIDHDFLDEEYLGMHDRIEEMGMYIVRRSHPDKPYKHSRLWIDKEIEDILADNLGTQATRYIRFHTWKLNPEVVMKGLIKMKELRFLNVVTSFSDVNRSDCSLSNLKFFKFPNALRYLCWTHYPFRSLPKTFQADNLVALKMAESGIVQLWEGEERKLLTKLRFLDLSHSMLRTLDLRLTPNIETLNLRSCGNLVEVHMIAECFKLISCDLSFSKLRILDLRSAPNLELLGLEGCSNLEELQMPGRSPNLRSLKLTTNSKIMTLDVGLTPNLETLDLSRCDNLVKVPRIAECLKLISVDLSFTMLRTLDLGSAPNLELLGLEGCLDLVELQMPGRSSNLRSLKLTNSKIRTLNIGLTPNLEELDLRNCHDIEELHMARECLKKPFNFNLGGCLRFRSFQFCIDSDDSCTEDDFSSTEDESLADDSLSSEDESHEVGPLAKLHVIAESLDGCPLHPDNNLPKFQLKYFYKEDQPLLNRNLEKLTSVGLCDCTNLDTLSRSICGLQRLRELKLQGGIPEVPKDLDQLKDLEKLKFSCTNIKYLPHNICMLKQLKSLNLNGCSLLEKLPEDLDRLKYLKKLTLASEKIKDLPDSICMLKYLISLKLSRCSLLEKLPEDLGRLECLKKLTLASSNIKDLPDSICMLKRLESFDLNECLLLEKLPENLGRLVCLKYLDLSSTKIKDLPDSICMLKHLKYLKVSYCWLLEKLPVDLGRLECLEDLSLCYCKFLRDIPDSICKMKYLKQLRLWNCIQLEELPEELGRLKCLKYLDLRGTHISHLPQSIFMLKGLCITEEAGPVDSSAPYCYVVVSTDDFERLGRPGKKAKVD